MVGWRTRIWEGVKGSGGKQIIYRNWRNVPFWASKCISVTKMYLPVNSFTSIGCCEVTGNFQFQIECITFDRFQFFRFLSHLKSFIITWWSSFLGSYNLRTKYICYFKHLFSQALFSPSCIIWRRHSFFTFR